MGTTKVLIAYPEEEFCQSLVTALGEGMRICTCDTGTKAMELLDSFQPQVLVLDLVLPGLDGLAILQRLMERPVKPGVLVVSRFMSAYVWSALERLGIEYVLRPPCSMDAAVAHIRNIAADFTEAAAPQFNMEAAGAGLLMQLGMSAKLDGFQYLQAALPMFVVDNRMLLTKELYVEIGKMYNKTPRLVERSIRHAIDRTWSDHGQESLWRELFPSSPGLPVPRPSNGVFIAHLSSRLAYLAAS